MTKINKNRLLRVSIIVIITLIFIFLPILHTDSKTSDTIIIAEEVPEPTVPELIAKIAPTFGQDPQIIQKIIYCESGGEIKSHDGGRGTNITGIHNTTFNYWLPKYEASQKETLNIDSTYDQIKMMSWAFSQGYANQWTTYVAYTNGGTYTFYSSLIGKIFTAKCK